MSERHELDQHDYNTNKILKAAHDALRSYQYGNSSPDLAEEIADAIAELTRDKHNLNRSD